MSVPYRSVPSAFLLGAVVMKGICPLREGPREENARHTPARHTHGNHRHGDDLLHMYLFYVSVLT